MKKKNENIIIKHIKKIIFFLVSLFLISGILFADFSVNTKCVQKNYVTTFSGILVLKILSIIITFFLLYLIWLNFEIQSRSEGIKNKVYFNEVGGLSEAKEELKDIISYFKNPLLFSKKGIKIPKGVILSGPPGNGKTILAKAFATECNVPFIFSSASEFDQLFVGSGSIRIKSLFNEAKSYPNGCVIFIDEIDSIGVSRYRDGVHSSQTLNQLLSEMDGFLTYDKVVVLAATNRLDVIDSALLRPGRFDRKIVIGIPNFNDRKEILKINLSGKSFDDKINVDELASMTENFSGSEIVNLINDALILSIREKKELIDQDLIFESIDRVLFGPSSKNRSFSFLNKKTASYHEAGHALIGLVLPETKVRKITINSRNNIGGYTWIELYKNEKQDSAFLSKKQILSQIMSLIGGKISEELIFGSEEVTSGSYSDLKKINVLLDRLVVEYNMSDIDVFSNNFDGNLIFSENSKTKIENEKAKIFDSCKKEVKKILLSNMKTLKLLAEVVIEKNMIFGDDIIYIFINKKSPYLKLIN